MFLHRDQVYKGVNDFRFESRELKLRSVKYFTKTSLVNLPTSNLNYCQTIEKKVRVKSPGSYR